MSTISKIVIVDFLEFRKKHVLKCSFAAVSDAIVIFAGIDFNLATTINETISI